MTHCGYPWGEAYVFHRFLCSCPWHWFWHLASRWSQSLNSISTVVWHLSWAGLCTITLINLKGARIEGCAGSHFARKVCQWRASALGSCVKAAIAMLPSYLAARTGLHRRDSLASCRHSLWKCARNTFFCCHCSMKIRWEANSGPCFPIIVLKTCLTSCDNDKFYSFCQLMKVYWLMFSTPSCSFHFMLNNLCPVQIHSRFKKNREVPKSVPRGA